jgi:bloom syndrome protein/3-oxo-5-alpha-steroid 4-dehydrogenase 1
MPLARSDSLQDIDFTLRRQFNKTSFRYGLAVVVGSL